MNHKEILKDLNILKQAHEEFDKKHGREISRFVVKRNCTEEENLLCNTLIALTTKLNEIDHAIEYLQKPVVCEGVLNRNEKNQICLNNEPLEIFTEIEVLIHDEFHHGWTNVIVGHLDSGSYLVGLPRDLDINGIKARMR